MALTTEDQREIRTFVAERDEVFRSLDADRIIAFHAKHNPGLPPISSPHVALIAAHKARLQVLSFTEAEKAVSLKWLIERGYSADFYLTRPDQES